MQAHQVVIARLVQRVVVQQPAGMREGAAVLSLFLQNQDQPLESIAIRVMELLAQGHDPVVIAVGQ